MTQIEVVWQLLYLTIIGGILVIVWQASEGKQEENDMVNLFKNPPNKSFQPTANASAEFKR